MADPALLCTEQASIPTYSLMKTSDNPISDRAEGSPRPSRAHSTLPILKVRRRDSYIKCIVAMMAIRMTHGRLLSFEGEGAEVRAAMLLQQLITFARVVEL